MAMAALVLGLGDGTAGGGGRCRLHRHQLSRVRGPDEPCRRQAGSGVTEHPGSAAAEGAGGRSDCRHRQWRGVSPCRSSPSTARRRPARARWRGGSRRISGCPTSTPACCIARSAAACWMLAAIPADPAAAEAAARALTPADLERRRSARPAGRRRRRRGCRHPRRARRAAGVPARVWRGRMARCWTGATSAR